VNGYWRPQVDVVDLRDGGWSMSNKREWPDAESNDLHADE
jgi:hypothetical protein